MNRVFREFYASDTFKKVVCPVYASDRIKGAQPIIIDREHKGQQNPWGIGRWTPMHKRVTGSLDTAKQQFI